VSLKSRLIVDGAFLLVLAAALLFLPAGTMNYWEAWVFLAIVFIPLVVFSTYYYKRDPALIARRMRRVEKVTQQKWIMRLASLVTIFGLLIPGLDHRFGWTRRLTGGIPLWLEVFAQVVVIAGYLATMRVVEVNRFAARTIQVEEGQKVVSTGPYGIVRHPMYLGALVMWLASGPALGSYVALPFFALLIPVLAMRLLNEEKVLRNELPGYAEYCRQTRYRLIPHIW
jgi:protein-S-isoprenylcysteine O-methyltransferase Ste14